MLLQLNITMQIDTLQYLQNINDNIDAVRRIVDVSNSTIANEISAVNTMLVAFTIVFGVVGVLLGVYISWLQRKVSRMSDNIAEKEQKIISLAKTVEETDRKIHSDIKGLYYDLRDEETMALLHRLVEEPLDVSNLSQLLLARQLNEDGFAVLKQAYMKLKTLGPEIIDEGMLYEPTYRQQYTLLFFQHYLKESILDEDLRPDIIIEFKHGMRCAFKRDIIKSTEDFCMALSNNKVQFDKVSLLVNYLKALNESEYCNLEELKNIFQNKLNSDLLVEAIDKCTTDKVYLTLFGVEAPKESDVSEKGSADISGDEHAIGEEAQKMSSTTKTDVGK